MDDLNIIPTPAVAQEIEHFIATLTALTAQQLAVVHVLLMTAAPPDITAAQPVCILGLGRPCIVGRSEDWWLDTQILDTISRAWRQPRRAARRMGHPEEDVG